MKKRLAAFAGTVRRFVGFFLTTMGGFVAALNLATMFPNPEYHASWSKVFFALALSIFGGVMLHKSNPTGQGMTHETGKKV